MFNNSKCVAIEQDSDRVTRRWTQSSRDVLFAADGTLHDSENYVLGHPVERRYVGYVSWNGLVPASEDLAPKNSWDVYVAWLNAFQ